MKTESALYRHVPQSHATLPGTRPSERRIWFTHVDGFKCSL